jgi:aminoglycoside phosphotransferase (APT) family kinase protein
VLIHGAFEPGNIVVAAPQRLILTDWTGAGYGPAALDVARLLACLIAYTVAQPYTEDWYIDAGRAFLDSYGAVDSAVLRPLIGLELLAAKSVAVQRIQSEHLARRMLRERAFALLLDDDPLPW